jgi:hypothetical protein
MAEWKRLKQQGRKRPYFRGLSSWLFYVYVWILIFALQEATYERDQASGRAARIEKRLLAGELWPEDRRALEDKARQLRHMERHMFGAARESTAQVEEVAGR